MKKNKRCLALVAMSILFIQLTIGFVQPVFASVEKSSVGITFKGSTPQTQNNSEKQIQVPKNQSSSNKNERRSYPKTNEKNNPGMILAGLLIIAISLGWINWQNTKRRRKNEKNSFNNHFI